VPTNSTLTVIATPDDGEMKIIMSNFLCPQCGNTSDYAVDITIANLGLFVFVCVCVCLYVSVCVAVEQFCVKA
jgi:hypothetical protein